MEPDRPQSLSLEPLACERVMLEHLPELPADRALVISPGRAQVAAALRSERKAELLHAWFLDLHHASVTRGDWADDALEILCGADLPENDYDLVAMPVSKKAEGELTRDLMQQAHQRLVHGGHLLVSVDNAKDTWLHEEMRKLFTKVSCDRRDSGCVYWAKKTGQLKKIKDFRCEFTYRDSDRTLTAVSRPGVFSHRRMDAGANQLLKAADIVDGDRVLDIGCGSGVVALAAAFRSSSPIYAVDSNARAVECVAAGAEINGLDNVQALWNADGDLQLDAPVDIALANPPYFGDFTIAEHFIHMAVDCLRAGGALLVVNKRPTWYEDYFASRLEDIVIMEAGKYHIACGCKPGL